MSSFGKPKFYDAMPAAQEDPELRRKRIASARKNGEELKELIKTFTIGDKVETDHGEKGIVRGFTERSIEVKIGFKVKTFNPRILKIIS